jgi:hypothetical protein
MDRAAPLPASAEPDQPCPFPGKQGWFPMTDPFAALPPNAELAPEPSGRRDRRRLRDARRWILRERDTG